MKKFKNGIYKQNPLFVLSLGLCIALATSASFIGGLVMAIITSCILIITTILAAIVSRALSKDAKLIASVIVAASLTTIVKLMLDAYAPSLTVNYEFFFPLISVSSLITTLSLKEDTIAGSLASSLGSAIGFILAIALLAIVREVLASGALTLYNPMDVQNIITVRLFPEAYAITLLADPFGAFVSVGLLSALCAALQNKKQNKKDGKVVA